FGIGADPQRIVGKHIERPDAIKLGGASAIAYARPIASRRRIYEQRRVSCDPLPTQEEWIRRIRDEVSKNPRKGSRRIQSGSAECLIDRLCELRVLSLPAAEEESLVLPDGTCCLDSELVHLNFRFRRSLRIGEKFIAIERRITHELEKRSMKLIEPLRVAAETEAPLLRPSSGVALLVVTLYSCTLSGFRRYKFETGFGTDDSLASIPSTVTLTDRSRAPLT